MRSNSAGSARTRELEMEARFTLCNMADRIRRLDRHHFAPDESDFRVCPEGRPFAPSGPRMGSGSWHTGEPCPSDDDDAKFDKEIIIDCDG